MADYSNYQVSQIPAYSGITINISNPTLNAAPLTQNCPECANPSLQQPRLTVDNVSSPAANVVANPEQYEQSSVYSPATQSIPQQVSAYYPVSSATPVAAVTQEAIQQPLQQEGAVNPQNGLPQAYPQPYYLNNYNYIQSGETAVPSAPNAGVYMTNPQASDFAGKNGVIAPVSPEIDMSTSQDIIDKLDTRVQEEKALEKNGKKTRVVALTNEYIMSLENYLNNPNKEVRLMASKEILKRLDEDKDRYDDAALNALLNKMLQDPNKLVRISALSAFASQLASGNDYTVKLLQDIQNNPNADKEDVVQAADILLKMSAATEIRYVPVKPSKQSSNNAELENVQKQNEQLRAQLQNYQNKEIEKMLNIPQGAN